MTTLPESQGAMNFIKKYLFESSNYKFSDGTTQAISVPYPDAVNYRNYILDYQDATNTEILEMNIDQMYSEVVDFTTTKIANAYEFIYEERGPHNSTTTNVLITVGVSDYSVDDGSSTYWLQHLQLKYGFRALAVSIGKRNSLKEMAESEDWYFTVKSDNGQWVADQISRIICNL